MKYNKLNRWLHSFFTALALMAFVSACNDNDSTANNSTDSTTTLTPGSSSDSLTTNTPAAPTMVVKRGSVSAALKEDDQATKITKDRMGFYNRTEVAPSYNGSIENYITNNIQYPQEAIDNNAEGTVYVQFGVDENGNISNVNTVGKKLGYGLDEEAVKVVSNMPKWKPGQIKGKAVKTWRTLPITYKLES